MSDQKSMFHQVNGIVVSVPYVRGSATSEAAAKSLTPETLNRMQRAVYDAIRAAGSRGLTDEEGITVTEMNPSSFRPRRIELARAGLIEKNGTRPTRSGRGADVYITAKEK
jgi:triphosphoribosyl-dephospho-CoA synthetase